MAQKKKKKSKDNSKTAPAKARTDKPQKAEAEKQPGYDRREQPYRFYGAHVSGGKTTFRLYAPEATQIKLLRDGNGWGNETEYLYRHDDGTWDITVDDDMTWQQYKYLIRNDHDYLPEPYEMARIDPFSRQLAVQHGPGGSRTYNSVVTDMNYFQWTKKHLGRGTEPLSIYEMHLSTFWDSNYREIAEKIVQHIGYLGFTHIQIMPPFQTPIHESWGYLVGCPYAINERYGSVDDFKYLVNACHEADIGVIVDIPLGFGIQDWDCGLSSYDGTDLYHHAGARGWNRQWQSRIYNHCSPYVRDYLTGIASYLYHELGVDGARIDAVSAQIFLDYDRGDWDWPRNDRFNLGKERGEILQSLGGDRHFENRGYYLSEAVDFDAIDFLREFHARLSKSTPEFFTIAEESRRVFPRLATPVKHGGLGFTFAQNMGEMHRVRKYLSMPVESRKIEQIEDILLTHHEEKFVNAMNTHDECANGKVRLVTELGNHLQIIGLAALCWFRPGAPMIFQGDEFLEEGWFDIRTGLDWLKTGPGAMMHQQQMTSNIHDLNHLLRNEPALFRQGSGCFDRAGSNNEQKWFAFVRWAGEKRWDSDNPDDHAGDIIFVRNESQFASSAHAEIYTPAEGEYQVIYNSIDQRYIGQQGYNDHDPYWRVHTTGRFLYIGLHPMQNIALKLVR